MVEGVAEGGFYIGGRGGWVNGPPPLAWVNSEVNFERGVNPGIDLQRFEMLVPG